MLKLKIINDVEPLKMKVSVKFPNITQAKLQEKEIIPSKQIQEVVSDGTYDGLSKVIVNKIPDEYIKPSGTIEISANGVYDVSENSKANVDVPSPLFSGNFDRIGLKKIGWSDEDINYCQKYGVQWDKDDDDKYMLSEDEMTFSVNTGTRYYPKIPVTRSFESYNCLIAIPKLDVSDFKSTANMFKNCYSLTSLPELDFSENLNFSAMFMFCTSLIKIPNIDTSKGTNFMNCFSFCYSLREIPEINVINAKNMASCFSSCFSLRKINIKNTQNIINMNYTFDHCASLNAIPEMETPNVFNFSSSFSSCYALITVPKLNMKSATNINNVLYGDTYLKNVGGFENLGQAYSTTASANNSNYALTISYCLKLTHDSLMNVINNLYDIKTKGCKTQQLLLGSINLAKLTAEEIAIATNKGWTVS